MTREPDGARGGAALARSAAYERADLPLPARRDTTCEPYNLDVRATDFDELAFFRAIQRSGARALLIGRRALVVWGLPVLTADDDFWIALDDIVHSTKRPWQSSCGRPARRTPPGSGDATPSRTMSTSTCSSPVPFRRSKA